VTAPGAFLRATQRYRAGDLAGARPELEPHARRHALCAHARSLFVVSHGWGEACAVFAA